MRNFILVALVCFAFYGAASAQSSTSPRDLLTSGQAKEDKRDLEGALADYEQAIRLRPDLAESYFRRGRVLGRQGKTNAAVSDFSKALELDPNLIDALKVRANLLLTRRQDYVGSIADFDKLINLGLDLDQSYYMRGLAKARLRDFQGAIVDYTAVIELPSRETPNYKPASFKSVAYSARGAARLALSDFEGATADFTAALNHDSRSGWDYLQRARAFAAKGEHESAQADYDKAVELSPDLARVIDGEPGRNLEKRRAATREERQAAAGRELKTATDYFNRGNASLKKKDYDSAIADFTKAVELDPKFRYAYSNRGSAFKHKNDIQRAIADYTKAIELAPLEENGYYSRAVARQRAGDSEGAIKDFSKAIELAPHMAHLYESRGVALLLAGRDDEAKLDFEKCLRLNPSAGQWLDVRIRRAKERRTAGRR